MTTQLELFSAATASTDNPRSPSPRARKTRGKKTGHVKAAPARGRKTSALNMPIKAEIPQAIAARGKWSEKDRELGLPPYETIALVLQGGGALGAYQAGVFQGLSEAGIEPDRLSGISIGALNTAIIAGNPPEKRIARLVEFWETICQPNLGLAPNPFIEQSFFNLGDAVRQTMSALSAASAVMDGQKGFFKPRFPSPAFTASSNPGQASYYDTSPLKETLERLCDFDRINSGELHVSVGAVNVRTGNFNYFDNTKIALRPEHFMASGALPPAFPAIEIDGEYYWDGGLVSNTPLSDVLNTRPRKDTLVFQVDLWSARGRLPANMSEVSDRIKEIQYSSRTRLVTEHLRWTQYLRHVLLNVLEDVPAEARTSEHYCKLAQELSSSKHYNVVHLIYRDKPYEQYYKDYQFDLATMRGRWASGLQDIRDTLAQPNRLAMPDNDAGFVTHDVHREEIEQSMRHD
ncbi:patatin-like phospholipase family protein [Paralcaligenes ginsengisoli]|jgi:NTE family protein